MKTTLLATILVTGLSTAIAQAAPAAAASSAKAAASSGTAAQPGQTPPVVPGPTLPVRTIPYPPSTTVNGTSAPVANPNAMNNELGSSNQSEEAGETNGGRRPFAIRNQTVTASDRVLLGTLEQNIRGQLGIASRANSPVHFFIDNGTVTVLGTVANPAERASILADVQQTPGVLQVYNDLHIGTPGLPARPNRNFFGAGTDHAFSATDRALLTTVQQEAAAQLGINSASAAQMPVHFSIQNGVVGVSGRVNSPQEKAALLADIQRTPGVNRVVDNVAVVQALQPDGANVENPVMNGATLPATSRENETNRLLENTTTNSSGY